MREALDLLRAERGSRLFFLALAQSAFGTGAAYVALLLIAFDRCESPLAITIGSGRRPPAGDVARAGLRRRGRSLVAADRVWSWPTSSVRSRSSASGSSMASRRRLTRGPGWGRHGHLHARRACGAAEPRGAEAAARRDLALRGDRRRRVHRRAGARGCGIRRRQPRGGHRCQRAHVRALGDAASHDLVRRGGGRPHGVPRRSLLLEAREGVRPTSGMVGVRVLLWASARRCSSAASSTWPSCCSPTTSGRATPASPCSWRSTGSGSWSARWWAPPAATSRCSSTGTCWGSWSWRRASWRGGSHPSTGSRWPSSLRGLRRRPPVRT